MQQSNYYVITGGPGVGKTTVLTRLGQRGFTLVPEDARRIIQEQVAANGEGVPWLNRELYAQLMLKESKRAYQQAPSGKSTAKPVFFDRGLIDAVCYMMMEGIPVSNEINKLVAACTYAHTVFILPPWKEIYKTDGERKQTWAEAVRTYEALKEAYARYGYEVTDVPKDTVENRADFILKQIGEL